MATMQFVEPNHYTLSGKHIHMTYSTTGIDGKPQVTYQDSQRPSTSAVTRSVVSRPRSAV